MYSFLLKFFYFFIVAYADLQKGFINKD